MENFTDESFCRKDYRLSSKSIYDNRGYGLSLCYSEDQERVQHEILQVLNGKNSNLMDLEFRSFISKDKLYGCPLYVPLRRVTK